MFFPTMVVNETRNCLVIDIPEWISKTVKLNCFTLRELENKPISKKMEYPFNKDQNALQN